jgi:hypothetical protein
MDISPAPHASPLKKLGCRWEMEEEEEDMACRYEVLRYKHMKRHDYYPGVEAVEIPACYKDLITKHEWEDKLFRLNTEIYNWWSPGNKVRNMSYMLGTICLLIPCLFVYAAMDEVGNTRQH